MVFKELWGCLSKLSFILVFFFFPQQSERGVNLVALQEAVVILVGMRSGMGHTRKF